MNKTIGIIGFGDFARLMVRELSPYFKIVVSTRSVPDNKDDFACEFVDTKTALSQDLIIPSMPSQFLREFFTENKEIINERALIVDVCSVKVRPIEVLVDVLPETCEILATHPMFGPFSAKDGVAGLQIMIHPTRINDERYHRIKSFLEETLKLKLIECTPDEHDKQLAYVLGLTQYIGRVVQNMNIPETLLRTSAYEDLLDMKRIQGNDSWELFESIMLENPYAIAVNDELKYAMEVIDKRLYEKTKATP